MMGIRLEVKKGDRYGRLTIVEETEKTDNQRKFLCLCDCGNKKEINLLRLRSGKTKSCGCYSVELAISRSTTHGQYGTPLYRVWNSMKQRCENPKTERYERYGGRGIKVCEEWLDFNCFFEWSMDNGYAEGLTLDRIENNSDYEPSNCRWTTVVKQMNNRSTNHFLTYDNKTMTIADWGRETGINPAAINKRLRRGWAIEKALTKPLQERSDNHV
jgi:hypothetical protein